MTGPAIAATLIAVAFFVIATVVGAPLWFTAPVVVLEWAAWFFLLDGAG